MTRLAVGGLGAETDLRSNRMALAAVWRWEEGRHVERAEVGRPLRRLLL